MSTMHVLRNPYDNAATLRTAAAPDEVRDEASAPGTSVTRLAAELG